MFKVSTYLSLEPVPIGAETSTRLAMIGCVAKGDADGGSQLDTNVKDYWGSRCTHTNEKVREDCAAIEHQLAKAEELTELAELLEGTEKGDLRLGATPRMSAEDRAAIPVLSCRKGRHRADMVAEHWVSTSRPLTEAAPAGDEELLGFLEGVPTADPMLCALLQLTRKNLWLTCSGLIWCRE